MKSKNKPRILFFAPLPPPVHGSAVVSQQIRNSELIHEVFDGDFVNLSTSRQMSEIGKGGIVLNLKKLFRFAGSYLRALRLLAFHRYDLCYLAITCHGQGFLKDAPFVLLCKLFGRKVVIHQHNKGMSKDVDRPLFHWMFQKVYKDSKVILLSWHLYPDIARVVKREDVLICPNGINPTVNGCVDRSGHDVPHILFLSNLLIDKGVLVLMDALKQLKEKGLSFVCDFVGSETKDMDASRFVGEVEKRALEKCAFYHGRKYGTDKDAYWQRADIFVSPTLNECFPLVNLEAMEYGLPIVSTPEGGIPDEVIDGVNGYLVEKNNPAVLADAIEKLLVDVHLRTAMGEAGRERFTQLFTQQVFEEKMLACLRASL